MTQSSKLKPPVQEILDAWGYICAFLPRKYEIGEIVDVLPGDNGSYEAVHGPMVVVGHSHLEEIRRQGKEFFHMPDHLLDMYFRKRENQYIYRLAAE